MEVPKGVHEGKAGAEMIAFVRQFFEVDYNALFEEKARFEKYSTDVLPAVDYERLLNFILGIITHMREIDESLMGEKFDKFVQNLKTFMKQYKAFRDKCSNYRKVFVEGYLKNQNQHYIDLLISIDEAKQREIDLNAKIQDYAKKIKNMPESEAINKTPTYQRIYEQYTKSTYDLDANRKSLAAYEKVEQDTVETLQPDFDKEFIVHYKMVQRKFKEVINLKIHLLSKALWLIVKPNKAVYKALGIPMEPVLSLRGYIGYYLKTKQCTHLDKESRDYLQMVWKTLE